MGATESIILTEEEMKAKDRHLSYVQLTADHPNVVAKLPKRVFTDLSRDVEESDNSIQKLL